MNTESTPLLILAESIVSHTPVWVWGVLALILSRGIKQLRDHEIPRRRLLLIPLLMGGLSVWGTISAFGSTPEVLAAWAIGGALAFAVGRAFGSPHGVTFDAEAGRYAVPGSAWPLVLMLTLFTMRYVVGVSLAFHPAWATLPQFALGLSLVYGALTGCFVVRAHNVLRGEGPALAFAS